jgi:hypothetical protein
MDIFLVSMAVSLVLVILNCALARSRWGARGVFCLSAPVALLLGMAPWVSLTWHAAATSVLALACIRFQARPRTILLTSLASAVIVYGALFATKPRLREVLQLRKEYPFVSLAPRLAYEPSVPAPAPGLSFEVERRLANAESHRLDRSWGRSGLLKLLHSHTVGDFVLTEGFGNRRTPRIGPDRQNLALPPAVPLPLPQSPRAPDYERGPDDPRDVADRLPPDNPPARAIDLLTMHENGALDFVDPFVIGYARDRDHVAGFLSHQFRKVPEIAVAPNEPPAPWRVVRLELVGLLKHAVPVAYVSQNLPRMDELQGAPTRPLDQFEEQSLERLKSDEDVVIEDTPDRIRMVGSLRAARQCLDCHSVSRGALLGAFSYELAPVARPRSGPAPVQIVN